MLYLHQCNCRVFIIYMTDSSAVDLLFMCTFLNEFTVEQREHDFVHLFIDFKIICDGEEMKVLKISILFSHR